MPYGENGCQLDGLTCHTAHTMNSTMMASLMSTTSLVRLVWLMPMESTHVMMSTMTKPGQVEVGGDVGLVP